MSNFVSENYIKNELKVLNKNIDGNQILMYVNTSEMFNLRPILGNYFYNYLLSAYTAQSLTADEENLVLLIKPAVAYRASSKAAFFLAGQLTNKGPQTQFSDNSSPTSDTYMYKLSAELRSYAEASENDIREWLKEYKDLYANYTSELNKVLGKPDTRNNFDSGVFII